MYLKSIKAGGFKSFADKIELNIDKGITSIVGPNGSGKSNVVDAIKWVLGEQSIKALRGSTSMTDVIFAGSKSRSAQNRAWVSLTFNNEDHYLSCSFEEVEIKRVLYKDGENEYYLNGAKVRLKDITDLFLDSGAGKESFNIISQGKIADVINAKPEERKYIIEEAAGVLKYKKRKEESIRKLEKTKDNLEKINLLIDEGNTNIEPLINQKEKAKEYLNFQDELKNIEISLIASDINNLNNEYNFTKQKISLLNEELENIMFQNASETSEIEKQKLECLKIEEKIEKKNIELIKISEELADLQSKKQLTIERQKYNIDSDKYNNLIISTKEEILSLQNKINSIENELAVSKETLEKTKQVNTNLNNELQRIKAVVDNDTQTKNKLNTDLYIINNKINILNEEIDNNSILPNSVRSILNNIRLKGIYGTISSLIKVPDKYASCIDNSLSSSSNYIVTDDEKSAQKAIEYLKDNKLGRATFLPLNQIKPKNILFEDNEKIKKIDGYIGTADTLVDYDSKYKNAILSQLGNVIVVDSIESMNKIGKSINYKYKVISLTGEILYAGGSLNGGSDLPKKSLISLKKDLNILKNNLQEKEFDLESINKDLNENNITYDNLKNKLEENTRKTFILIEETKTKEDNLNNYQKELENKQDELNNLEQIHKKTIDKQLENIMETYSIKMTQKEKINIELNHLKDQKNQIKLDIEELERNNRLKNSTISNKQTELKNHEINLNKLDLKLDNLLNTLNEQYSITYEKAIDKYILEIDVNEARSIVSNLKNKIRQLGDVNIGSIQEFDRINERLEFLISQRDDITKSIDNLYSIINEMDEIMKEKLSHTFEKVNDSFTKTFTKLFKGGNAYLKLSNPEDILSSGIEICALPPGKKMSSIALLSGGEKTLTAISLLFAILNIKPVPFVVLDEVEAALDESNVESFGKYLIENRNKSQYILITHKKKTMEYADILYGITMQESGVSKIVSVKLEK